MSLSGDGTVAGASTGSGSGISSELDSPEYVSYFASTEYIIYSNTGCDVGTSTTFSSS